MSDHLRAAILLAIVLGAGALGWFGNGWRLDADHQREMTTKQGELDTANTSIREQNHAIETLGKASEAAEARRKLAEQYASGIVARIGSRADAVAASKAKDCDGVMREAWGNWK